MVRMDILQMVGLKPKTVDLHDSSLEGLILSTELQQASFTNYKWRVAAAYRGAQILSDLVGVLPWFPIKGGPYSGSPRRGLEEELELSPNILIKPDPFMSAGDWKRQTVLSLIWTGNAYWRYSGYADGRPTMAQVCDPYDVTVSWSDSRKIRKTYRWQGHPVEHMGHLALNMLPGHEVGVGPFDSGKLLLAGQNAADDFARDLFQNGGIPTSILNHPRKLTGPEARELLDSWEEGQGVGRKTGVVSGGVTYETISLTPDEAQMLQSRSFGVSEVARYLGIPAHLLNAATGVAGASSSSMTYQNVTQVFSELTKTTLAPVYLARMEEEASTWLPRGQSVKFDTDVFDRPDRDARFKAYDVALGANFLTVDEVRAAENLPPSPELMEKAAAPSPNFGGETADVEPATNESE